MGIGELKNEQKTARQNIAEEATHAIVSVYSIGYAKGFVSRYFRRCFRLPILERRVVTSRTLERETRRRAIVLVESKNAAVPQKTSFATSIVIYVKY